MFYFLITMATSACRTLKPFLTEVTNQTSTVPSSVMVVGGVIVSKSNFIAHSKVVVTKDVVDLR